MMNREDIELHITDHLVEMELWIGGNRSYTNTFHPDHALVAFMDAQEVIKHSVAIQAYAALLRACEPVSKPLVMMTNRDVRNNLYDNTDVAELRDFVVILNHRHARNLNVNAMSKGELITAIIDVATSQDIAEFLHGVAIRRGS